MNGLKKNYEKKARQYKLLFGIVGLIVIPIYALIFSQFGPDGDLVLVTFSQIGARYGAFELLIIWGILTSLYFMGFLSYLATITKFNNLFMSLLIGFGGLSMLVTVFFPFAPSMFPITANTHNTLAYVTAVATLFSLVVFVGSLIRIDKAVFFKSLITLVVTIAICLTVLIVFGVSSLFQIVFSALLCGLLFLILRFLEKSPFVDIPKVLEEIDRNKNEQETN